MRTGTFFHYLATLVLSFSTFFYGVKNEAKDAVNRKTKQKEEIKTLPIDQAYQQVIDKYDELQRAQAENSPQSKIDQLKKELELLKLQNIPQCPFVANDSQKNLAGQLITLHNNAHNANATPSAAQLECQNQINQFNKNYSRLGSLQSEILNKKDLTEEEKIKIKENAMYAEQAAAAFKAIMNADCSIRSNEVLSVSNQILGTMESSALILGTAIPSVGLAASGYLLVKDLTRSVFKWLSKQHSDSTVKDMNQAQGYLNSLCAYRDLTKLYAREEVFNKELEKLDVQGLKNQITDRETKINSCSLTSDPVANLVNTSTNILAKVTSETNSKNSKKLLCVSYVNNRGSASNLKVTILDLEKKLNCEKVSGQDVQYACEKIKTLNDLAKDKKPADCDKEDFIEGFISAISDVSVALNDYSTVVSLNVIAANEKTNQEKQKLQSELNELKQKLQARLALASGNTLKADIDKLHRETTAALFENKLKDFVSDEIKKANDRKKELKKQLAEVDRAKPADMKARKEKLKMDAEREITNRLKGARDVCLHHSMPFFEGPQTLLPPGLVDSCKNFNDRINKAYSDL